MKLETRTMQILKNFALINPSMLFREGNVQSSIAAQKTILARTTLKEAFPQEFAIFDLEQFVDNISTDNADMHILGYYEDRIGACPNINSRDGPSGQGSR